MQSVLLDMLISDLDTFIEFLWKRQDYLVNYKEYGDSKCSLDRMDDLNQACILSAGLVYENCLWLLFLY